MVDPMAVHWVSRMAETTACWMVDPTAVHWDSTSAAGSACWMVGPTASHLDSTSAAGSACWMVGPMASHWDSTSAETSAQLRADSKAVQSEDATAVLLAVLLARQLAPYSVLRWDNWFRLAVSDDWSAATSWALHSAVP